MIYIQTGEEITLDWTVYKRHSYERENFSDCIVHAFLVGEADRWSVPVRKDEEHRGIVHLTLPADMELEEGVYGMKLVWARNRRGRYPVGALTWANARSICMSEVSELFAITESEGQATAPGKPQHYALRSSALTYGRDGLDAYERASLMGLTDGLSESEWTQNVITSIQEVWNAMAAEGLDQIDASHLQTALANYVDRTSNQTVGGVKHWRISGDMLSSIVAAFENADADAAELVIKARGEYKASLEYRFGEVRLGLTAGKKLCIQSDGRLMFGIPSTPSQFKEVLTEAFFASNNDIDNITIEV